MAMNGDGSFLGFEDKNGNDAQDSGENKLFTVEIDAEKGRLIATDISNNVRDQHFSASGLLTGLLIGNLLNRQKAAGVSPSSLSSKMATPRSANISTGSSANARSRAGSGSHSTGK